MESGADVDTKATGDSPIRVEKAVRRLKDGKSLFVDNIPAEILKHGGSGIIESLLPYVRKSGPLIIPLLEKGYTRLSQIYMYRAISVICHPRKVMLRVILNRLMKHCQNQEEKEAVDDQRISGFMPNKNNKGPQEKKKRGSFGNAELQSSQASNQKKTKHATENWITDWCQEIDCGARTGNIGTAFNNVKLLTQRRKAPRLT